MTLDTLRSLGRPRITLVAHRVDDSGGMERVHAEMIRRLLDRYDFTVISSQLAPDLRGRVKWRQVPLPGSPAPLRVLLFYVLGAIRVWRTRCEIVHVCGAVIPNHADLASVHYCHAGYVASQNRLAPSGAPILRRLNTTVHRLLALVGERWSYRPSRLRLLVAVSRVVRDELNSAYPGLPARVVANGVDLTRFSPSAAERRALRSQVSVPDDACVTLFVGGDWDRKGLGLAMEALALARTSHPSIELWIVGSGDERRYRAVARRAGVAKAIRFFGPSAHVERYYRGADLFLCCSTYEPFSLALLEAAACGLPLVTTRVGISVELVSDDGHNGGGLFVDPSPSSIACALGTLAGSPLLRAQLGAVARERATGFSWDRLADEFNLIYQDMLVPPARREPS